MLLAQQFHDLFTGLPRAYGTFDIKTVNHAKGGKREGMARTYQKPVTPGLWRDHLKGERTVGIVPIRDDATCCFGVIDIDSYDLDLIELEAKIRELDMPLILCRSKSGGAHLYLFLLEPVPSIVVRTTLLNWTGELGFGVTEVFPKQIKLANDRDVGNWINMPYFDHKNTERYAIYEGRQLSAEDFVELAYSKCVTQEELETRSATNQDNEFSVDAPPCLEQLTRRGFPQGTRNSGLFSLGIFARMKYPDDWEIKLSEYNHTYMDPPLDLNEVNNVVKSIKRKKEYFYQCENLPISAVCNKELCRMRPFGIGGDSDHLNILITNLTQIDTVPPTWFVEINGQRCEVTTEELRSQAKFSIVAMERLRILPTVVSKKQWDKMLADLLENAEVIEAPEDASPHGQFYMHLDNFLTRAPARSRDEIQAGKVWHENGKAYFRSNDLLKYLDQQHFRSLKQTQIWPLLRERGGGQHQFHIKGSCTRVWFVPEPENIQEDDFDVIPVSAGEF